MCDEEKVEPRHLIIVTDGNHVNISSDTMGLWEKKAILVAVLQKTEQQIVAAAKPEDPGEPSEPVPEPEEPEEDVAAD